jgi:hypothetical protein
VVEPAARDIGEAVKAGDVVAFELLVTCEKLNEVVGRAANLRGEEASQEVSNNATNTVLGKDIKRVVDANPELNLGG